MKKDNPIICKYVHNKLIESGIKRFKGREWFKCKPEYVVSVTIQAPQGIHWGGYLGGPVFKKVMSFVLQEKRIPPTPTLKTIYPLNEKDLKATQKP